MSLKSDINFPYSAIVGTYDEIRRIAKHSVNEIFKEFQFTYHAMMHETPPFISVSST